MKNFSKLFAVILALILVLSLSIGASAAQLDTAYSNAQREVSLLASDFEVSGTKLEPKTTLPSSYSSLELGFTTPVRNQMYNTCFAYGALSTLETIMLKDGNEAMSFSPMHLNHWGTLREDSTGWNRSYAGGGYSYISLGYLSSWQGPRLESDYSEQTSIDDFEALDKTAEKQASVNSIIFLDTGDIDTVKTAIYEYGAVVGNYHVDEEMYNSKTYAYYCNTEGLTTAQLNGHAISIVGWDDNFSKENFVESARPQNDGAWLCKNSWGKNWGDGGYYYISYEDNYMFDTRFGHSYTFNDYELFDSSKYLYQNEVDGATYEFDYVNQDTITYINVFDTNKEKNLIDKINFETTSQGASYKLYSIPVDENGTPTNDINKWIYLTSGMVPYQGYHSIDITDFAVKDDKFAIGVTLTKSEGSGNTIGVSEWLSTGGRMIFTPQADYGMSYIKYGATLEDVMDLYKDMLEDEIGGTFVIKAVGKCDCVIGDVDLDGIVTVLDATLIQKHLAELITLNEQQKAVADYDEDGTISILDATRIQIELAGMDFTANDFEDIFE